MNKFKNFLKENYYLLFAVIHTFLTFFTDKYIFELDKINETNYYSAKIVLFIILILFYNFLNKLIIKKNKNTKEYFKYFLIYFVPVFIILLLAWPGVWFGSDVINFYNHTKVAEFLYFLHYLTSLFYILGYMLFPCASGAIILQIILFSAIISYIIKNMKDIFKSNLVYLFYIPFFIFHTIFYVLFANRPVMFGITYLLLIAIFTIDKLNKTNINNKKLFLIAFITAIVANWRSETIYLIIAIPLFIFIVYKIKFNIKNTLKILTIFILTFILVSIPQKTYEKSVSENYSRDRNLIILSAPLPYMLSQELNPKDLEKDLANIDKVLDIEIMKKYPTYTDTVSAWNGSLKENFTEEEYDNFMKSYINFIKNNFSLFLKTKTLTFANSSNVFFDNFSSIEVGIINELKPKNIFGENVRKTTMTILEGRSNFEKASNIFYRITSNLLIPLLMIGLIFIYSIIKKKLFLFLLTGMLIGHTFILFITSPASYFMYYFNVYLCGWFLGILMIVILILKRKKKSYEV